MSKKYEIGEVVDVWVVGATAWARAEMADTDGALRIVGGDGALLERDDWVVVKRCEGQER